MYAIHVKTQAVSALPEGETSMEETIMAWKVTDECIGCESCVEVCPAIFAMDESTGKAVAINSPEANAASCGQEAQEICPVEAIVQE